jgi:catechol 2,3-dioxygenase-like lactoylglutathione lyase family enzyme
MKFAYTIVFVEDLEATLAFYERAFGLQRRFVHGSGQYGEMDTGDHVLAFSTHAFMRTQLPGFRSNEPTGMPAGFVLSLATDDVDGAYARATEAGAVPCSDIETKEWGQTVVYLRDNNGILVELATPVVP